MLTVVEVVGAVEVDGAVGTVGSVDVVVVSDGGGEVVLVGETGAVQAGRSSG